MTDPGENGLRMRRDGPDLGSLEQRLGDVFVECEIARTSRAVVYKIRAGGMGDRPLALKVALHPVEIEDLARFQHEVRLLSEARHPNVVEVYDFGVLPGGFPFLTMELLPPQDLFEQVGEGAWPRLADLALQAAAGLAHIHRQGIVHLDIKPMNLGLVPHEDGPPVLKILDFGLAQSVLEPLDRRIRGTLAYAAPEILLQDQYDHRADLYSLGMTLFQLATGVLPSAGDDMAAIRFHLEGETPDPLAYRPDMPRGLAEIVRRLLQRDPQRRFRSAAHLLVELGRATDHPVEVASLALGEGAVLASRLIGREQALDDLRGLLLQARRGEGTMALVEGAPGVGKSRLLREFRLMAALEGARVGLGRAVADRHEPFRPLLAALQGLGLDLAGFEVEPPTGTHTDEGRYRFYRYLWERLRDHGETEGPILLLFDDLHLAGPEMHELLAFLVPYLSQSRVLLIGSRRPEEGPQLLENSDRIRRVGLEPLSVAERQQLVEASLGEEELPQELLDWLNHHSGGFPSRLQQLLRHLVDEKVLRYRQEGWELQTSALDGLAVRPQSLEVLDRQRVAALEPEQRRTLEAAAAIQEPFHLETLATLLDRTPEGTYELLSGLVQLAMLEKLPRAQGEVYGFVESRLRQVVYDLIDPEKRRGLHRRLAELLGERLELGTWRLAATVAEHFWRSGARFESLPYLFRAGAEAEAVFGFYEAAEWYRRAAEAAKEKDDLEQHFVGRGRQADALEAAGYYGRALALYRALLEESPTGRRKADRRRRAELWQKAGQLHGRLGEPEAQLAACEEGLRILDGDDEGELAVDLLHGKAEALKSLGRTDEAFEAARTALKSIMGRHLPRQRASLLNTLGLIYYQRGDNRRAERLIRWGLRAAQRSRDLRLSAKLRNNLGNLLWRSGHPEKARELYEKNLALCEERNDLWGQLTALHNLGILECSRGNWKEARLPLSRSLELRQQVGVKEGEPLAWLNLGEVEEMLGDWAQARAHYERVEGMLRGQADHPDLVAAQVQLAALARKRGDWAEAESLVREGLASAERSGDRELLAYCHLQAGLVERDRERWTPAAAHLERALILCRETESYENLPQLHGALADLALRRGERTDAEAHAAQARQWAERLGNRFELGELAAVEARLALLRDEAELAEQIFQRGVKTLEELEVPFEYARTLYEWGMRTWSPEMAVERLDRALVAFERLGAYTEYERTRGVIDGIRERHRLGGGRRGQPGLWEVAKVINSSLDLPMVLDRIMDLVLERLRAERGMIVLCNPVTRDLEVAAARGLSEENEEGPKLSETVVRRVIEKSEPVLSVDALTDGRFAGAESIVASHIRSLLAVPMTIRNRSAGAIYLDHCRSDHLFGERDLEFLVAFADQAAVAIENARLFGELEQARLRLKVENESLRKEMLHNRHLGSLIGRSRSILELKQTLERVAQSASTVLIRGESGTGKGLVARILHSISVRREGPFIHFNCAALPETLVESELFGHEKGAFTGAVGQKPGRFELANGGTIFLDEIGKISLAVQAKLLRVVEDREFERVGGTRTLRSDVRIIAATNLNLEEAIGQNEFREDLYYRLNIIPIILPPLRERKDDIPYLVDHFLTKLSRDLGQETKELEPEVLDVFMGYRWPGNVRELEAAIHRSIVLGHSDRLTADDFRWLEGADPGSGPAQPGAIRRNRLSPGAYQELTERFDRDLLNEALRQSDGKIREAARLLGIARNTLKAKMKKYDLEPA